MKKLVTVVLLFLVATCLIIEQKTKQEPKEKEVAYEQKEEKNEKRAIFISYLEYERYLEGQNEKKQKEEIDTMFKNMAQDGFNMVIAHVRSFSDATYKSDIFPISRHIKNDEKESPSYDVLKYMIDKAHQHNMEFHAWINPYRISNNTDIKSIEKENPCFELLNTNHVKVVHGKGIFYNPASSKVKELIINGVKEIIENYAVDGIHFDDYFYPDNTIDMVDYLEYQEQGGKMTLEEFHLDQVNDLIKRVYQTIKNHKKDLLFGISPEGNIENNYQLNYADTRRWASSSDYVDYLMPQIYFGFENERKPYLETVTMWNELITNDHVKLMPALAFYKVGSIDQNALSGKEEWIENDDVIKKEVLVSRNLKNYQGFALFRYEYLYNETKQTETTLKEVENLTSILKS